MSLKLQKRLLDFLIPHAGNAMVDDVRIGLGYTAVRLESGHAGVAWTPGSDASGCTHFREAGTLTGRPVKQLLAMLTDDTSSLARAVGLAATNALAATLPSPPLVRDEIVSRLRIVPEDRVVMVGYFAPVVNRIRKTGCHLDIIELNSRHGDTLTPEQGHDALARCTVAVITGTSLITGTCDEIFSGLTRPRAAVLLGPSSPLCPHVFKGTPITHIAGSRVREPEAVLRVISEGGGTMLMKPYLDFVTARVDVDEASP